MNNNQNRISQLFLEGSDLQDREKEVLEDACSKMGFVPTRLMDRSHWWTSKEIGAFRYEGEYKGKKAVLKIQGIRPNTSEIYMIQAFKKANRSSVLRAPELYDFLPWDEQKRYEALVSELIEGTYVVNSPTNESELKEFFGWYREYRRNCVLSPWVDKPTGSISDEIRNNFAKWKEASKRLYENHPLKQAGDEALVNSAVERLAEGYEGVEATFQHGHFSAKDLRKISDNEIVVLSNLYWSWKPPFYDAVFGQHWHYYQLADRENISEEMIEAQRNLWLTEIKELAINENDGKLLKLAWLERAAAGLNLDALSIDDKKPMAKYLVEQTRLRVKKLMDELS